MDCKEALPWIHEYLDGDLERAYALELKQHLISCSDCNQVFKQLENIEALVMHLPKRPTPDGLKDRIMLSLPKPLKRTSWLKWARRHPSITVASLFIMVMLASFASLWDQDMQMVVKGSNLDQVVIRGDTVYIPSGHTVEGNLMVKRGKIQVDGQVNGNLVVIDGSYNLASTAKISGQVKQVDQAIGWLWFEVKELISLVAK